MSSLGTIEPTPNNICELCGKVAELRPYGPNFENICFECGMKDEKMAEKRFAQFVLGEQLDS